MKEIRTALLVLLVFSLLLGFVYPFLVTGLGQLAFSWRANGSLVTSDGRVVGSELLGQTFSSPRYFHGRPSASDYDAMASGASNLGPTNPALLLAVRSRVESVRLANGLAPGTPFPRTSFSSPEAGWTPRSASRVRFCRSIESPRHADAMRRPSGIWSRRWCLLRS